MIYIGNIAILSVMAIAGMASAENLALHRPYTLEPAPNWVDCVDAGDAAQLTDGAYAPNPLWNQPASLGWFKAKPVIITIDLGEEHPIAGISYRTLTDRAGMPGVASIEWPTAIYIFVSGEDNQFRFAGELTAMSLAEHGMPPDGEFAAYAFRTDRLKTSGRYVALGVWGQPFVFVDEVEVFSGDPASPSDEVQGELAPDLKSFMESRAIHAGVVRRLLHDAASIRGEVAGSPLPENDKAAIEAELDEAELAVRDEPKEYGESFQAVLPLNDLHTRILSSHARLWRGLGSPPLSVWTQASAYDPLQLLDDPPKQAEGQGAQPAVALEMMQNEYRSAAFNISNSMDKPAVIRFEITGLPGGANPDWITVHEVTWTDTAAGRPVAAALMPLAHGAPYEVAVPSGMTRQIWLLAHSAGIPAGTYQAEISLKSGEGFAQTLPLSVSIHPIRFPDKPRLHFGGWDYTDQDRRYNVTPENTDALITHLREHFVDSPWGTSACMPFGAYDNEGVMISPPDTAHMARWLVRWPNAGQYCVNIGAGDRLGDLEAGTDAFDRAVGAWAKFWAGYVKDKNVQPEQMVLVIVDEPCEPKQDMLILQWAKAIRAANTGMRIWEDPIWDDMTQANQDMIAACHVLCVNRPTALADAHFAEYFAAQREKGAQLDMYSCNGPARLLDAYAYYRLQAWTAWQYGASSMYFWAFGSGGSVSSFNEYRVATCAYTPLFIDTKNVCPGKEMEACREGIEDFEYLAMLKDAIARAHTDRRATRDAVEQADALLKAAPGRVLAGASPAGLSWRHQQDRGLADKVRMDILNALSKVGCKDQ